LANLAKGFSSYPLDGDSPEDFQRHEEESDNEISYRQVEHEDCDSPLEFRQLAINGEKYCEIARGSDYKED
jgi:hypothetical protein